MTRSRCSNFNRLRSHASLLAILSGGLLLPGAAGAQQQDTAAAQGISATAPDTHPADDSSDIVVTGTLIRGTPPVGSALLSITSADIEKTGSSTTAEIVSKVPQLNSFNSTPIQSRYFPFAPGMRGLPSNKTLILLDGRRVVGASIVDSASDFPNIPAIAIERVEVVADGASALYGADAVTGVVNFITRKKADGLEANVNYGVADNYQDFTASVLYGKTWDRGSFVAAYQYTKNDNVLNRDRFRTLDFRSAGGIDTRPSACQDANVTIPQTGSVTYAAPHFIANTLNQCDTAGAADLLPERELHNLYLSGNYDVTDAINLWGRLAYSHTRLDTRTVPANATVTISDTNPFFIAPPGTGATTETVTFNSANLFGADHVIDPYRAKIGNSALGVDFDLPNDFRASLFGTYGWSHATLLQPGLQLDATALSAAAAGTTTDTALDPFGTRTNPAVAAALTNSAWFSDIRQKIYSGGAKVDGPIFRLPAGDVKVALGAEYRKEKFSAPTYLGGVFVFAEGAERSTKSVYGEAIIPLFGDDNSTTLLQKLDVSVSGRYDDYSDFGSTSNPKVGVTWVPVSGITFRGTYGKSFRAPTLVEVGGVRRAFFYSAASGIYIDPTRGANQVDTIVIVPTANPDLQPERARTFSLGVDLAPVAIPSLRAGLTYYDIHLTGLIQFPPTGELFTNPAYASRITRNPTPAEVAQLMATVPTFGVPVPTPVIGNIIDQSPGNFGVQDTDGIDFYVSYRHDTGFGSVGVGMSGNHIFNLTRQSPNSTLVNSLENGIPRTAIRWTADLTYGPLDLNGSVNYRSGVTNNYTTPTGVASYQSKGYTTVNLRATLTLPDTGVTSGTKVALQVNDLFDAQPPFFPAGNGIGGTFNVLGRYISLDVRKSF